MKKIHYIFFMGTLLSYRAGALFSYQTFDGIGYADVAHSVCIQTHQKPNQKLYSLGKRLNNNNKKIVRSGVLLVLFSLIQLSLTEKIPNHQVYLDTNNEVNINMETNQKTQLRILQQIYVPQGQVLKIHLTTATAQQQKIKSTLESSQVQKTKNATTEPSKVQADNYTFNSLPIEKQNQSKVPNGAYPTPTIFCLLSVLTDQHPENWVRHFTSFKGLQGKTWQGYYYVQNPQTSSEWMQSKFSDLQHYITFLKSSGDHGRDHYDALQNRCPYYSVVILTQQDEQFLQVNKILTEIEKSYESKALNYIWIHSYVDSDEKTQKFNLNFPSLRRSVMCSDEYDQTRNMEEKYDQKKQTFDIILNHVRIFKRQFFSYIAFIDLTYENETFYQSKLAFLFPLTEMSNIWNSPFYSKNLDIHYAGFPKIQNDLSLYKKFSNKKSIASQEQKEEVMEICYKRQYPRMVGFMNLIIYNNPKNRLWGKTYHFNALQRNISKQQKIPKLVHQIWVSSLKNGLPNLEVPFYKQKFMQTIKKTYEDYEYRLWTNKDITEENFPQTFKKIQEIFQVDKTCNQSRMSMIGDLMKYEILYKYGGLYFDTNIESFQSMDHLRKYEFIAVSQIQPMWTQFMSSGLLGCQKGNNIAARLVSSERLQKINITGKSNKQSGPWYLAQTLEIDDFLKIKVLPPEKMYPFYKWADDNRCKVERCSFQQNIPKQLEGTYEEVIEIGKTKIIYPCNSRYPGKYTIDHFNQGLSWLKNT